MDWEEKDLNLLEDEVLKMAILDEKDRLEEEYEE